MPVRENPRMTFSALCHFLTASHVRQLSILRQQKYPRGGPIRSYSGAMRQIRNFAVDGTPLDPASPTLGDHEREVIRKLIDHNWHIPTRIAERPPARLEPMVVLGVEISVYPDLILRGAHSVEPNSESGALKFYLTKTRELNPHVGRWMASFLYHYRSTVEQDPSTDPDLCLIYDARRDDYHAAGKSYKRLFRNIEGACQFIGAIWPSL